MAGAGDGGLLMKRLGFLVLLGLIQTLPRVAGAQSGAAAQAPAHAYALVVGSNEGGPGQGALRYAEDDAQRVAEVLQTLGGYAEQRIERLQHPSVAELLAALSRMHDRLGAHAAAGEQAQFFFYYSGHARADALNLGKEQLELQDFRERVLALPATLSIVVLDACQSGAFSRVKGAAPAADFSANSVERLTNQGVAVIASSSGVELSQESEELRSGYFTHHLLVALRGGGDVDHDGRVTLAEAYRYAYNRTLAATALTAVGEQHVTLETDLVGKGEVPLTYPAEASARLRVPQEFVGRVLVQQLPSWSVLAELDKVKGGAMIELALPPGQYAATVRRGGGDVLRCTLQLAERAITALDIGMCRPTAAVQAQTKGGAAPHSGRSGVLDSGNPDGDEGFVLELLLGLGERNGDRFQGRLAQFGFESLDTNPGRYSIALGRRIHHNLVAGLTYFDLDSAAYRREVEDVTQDFAFESYGAGAWLQGDLSMARHKVMLFGRIGGGFTWSYTEFDAVVVEPPFADDNPSFEQLSARTHQLEQTQFGYYAAFGGGVQIMVADYFGFQLEARYALAPSIDNEFGETHDAGGLALLAGLRFRTWE